MKSTKPKNLKPEKIDFKQAVLEILRGEQIANADAPLVVSLLERLKNQIERLPNEPV